jgi:predicted RNA-binding Zn-ribbon protein involved in translation (DUF1610 family)
MEMDDQWSCRTCGIPLKKQKVVLTYLGHSFSHELPQCPQCGKVMITGELAEGKITEVETMLEDK